MMAADRLTGRNVHIKDSNDPATALGGLILTNGVMNENFYSMVEIFLSFQSDYQLRHEDGMDIQRDEQALRSGNYYIISTGRNPFAFYRPVMEIRKVLIRSTTRFLYCVLYR